MNPVRVHASDTAGGSGLQNPALPLSSLIANSYRLACHEMQGQTSWVGVTYPRLACRAGRRGDRPGVQP